MKTIFLRALEADDKASALLAAIRRPDDARGKQRFDVNPATFADLPSTPLAYWIPPAVLKVFQTREWQNSIVRRARNGLGTLDDFRFVRLSTEVPLDLNGVWFPFAKGGKRAPYYQDVVCCVKWAACGAELKAHIVHAYGGGHWSRNIRSVDYYFRPGLTWPLRGVSFSAQVVPAGGVFSVGGKMMFSEDADLLLLLAFLNSQAFDLLVKVFAGKIGGVQYQSGMIEGIPIPIPNTDQRAILEKTARRGWALKRALDTRTETSHAFTVPALLQVEGTTLTDRAVSWGEHVRIVEAELGNIQAEIDALCFDLYGISETDKYALTEGLGLSLETTTEGDVAAEANGEEDIDEVEDTPANTTNLTAELLSWAVGVALGRFDVRLANGTRPMSKPPEPFDSLPACSTAILADDESRPINATSVRYPLTFPKNGILTDDSGQASDLTAAVRRVFDEVFKARADTCWNEATLLLDPQGQDLRNWLVSCFFERHLKRYSKSRRKAPIVWQVGVPSGRYNVWLYAHRLTRDSFFQIQNDVVAPKLAHEERQLTSLLQSTGANPTAKERKEIAAQEAFVEELRAFLGEIKRVTPLWNPILDDGVMLTMGPLWRLVPQHKSWQKELKSKWEDLAAGKYDWAHLAMHLWPERVIPKCATDRSLAIAHGVEDIFWVEGDDGKWKPRPTPTRSVAELVRERISVAVKSALKSLLEAPSVNANGHRGHGRRAANAADGGAR